MEYKVILSESAYEDLDKIYSYITETLCTPQAAADLADEGEAKLRQLINHPYSFEASANIGLIKQGYRRIVAQDYIILYLVDERNKQVIIARIFYGRQKYDDLI